MSDEQDTCKDAAPEEAPKVAASGKYPLAGMPFKREDLAEATRRAFRTARAAGGIGWREARRRAYLWLLKMHFPRWYGYLKEYQR